jgi:diacylglycerol kinase
LNLADAAKDEGAALALVAVVVAAAVFVVVFMIQTPGRC